MNATSKDMKKILSKTAKSVLFFVPSYVLQLLRFEIIAFIGYKFSKHLKNLPQDSCYLNIGSGSSVIKGCINIDFFGVPGIDYAADLRKPLLIPDESVDGIFCEHTIEHLTYKQAQALLKECNRILKVGGVIRIILPDLSKFIEAYQADNSSWFANWENLMFTNSDDSSRSQRRLSSPIEAISFVTQEYGHLSCWDHEAIKLYLKRANFEKIEEKSFKVGSVAGLLVDLDAEDRKFVSLYVEAVK